MNSKKPPLKMLLTKEAFNTLFDVLTFFVESEARAGETYYSFMSAKIMNQFTRYGKFIKKRNEKDNIFLINLYENEAIHITRLYNKYISIHQTPDRDYYSHFSQSKAKTRAE